MDMTSFGRSAAPVPTQSYSASNFIGTPVPTLGQVGVTPTMQNTVGGGNKMHIAIIVALLIVGGYAAHHFFFTK